MFNNGNTKNIAIKIPRKLAMYDVAESKLKVKT